MPRVNISGGVKTSFEIARNFFQELDCTKHISSMPYHAYEMQPKAKKAYEEELDAEADLREAILRDTLPSYEHASAIPENRRREGFLVSVVGESGAYEANLMGIRAATMRTKLNKTREGALRALLWMTASARASKL